MCQICASGLARFARLGSRGSVCSYLASTIFCHFSQGTFLEYYLVFFLCVFFYAIRSSDFHREFDGRHNRRWERGIMFGLSSHDFYTTSQLIDKPGVRIVDGTHLIGRLSSLLPGKTNAWTGEREEGRKGGENGRKGGKDRGKERWKEGKTKGLGCSRSVPLITCAYSHSIRLPSNFVPCISCFASFWETKKTRAC